MIEIHATDEELRELLVTRLEVLDAAAFDAARETARRLRAPTATILTERARLPLPFLLSQLAQAWGVGYTDLKVSDIRPDVLRVIKEDVARARVVAAYQLQGKSLLVAMENPRDRQLMSELRRMVPHAIVPMLAPAGAIRRAHLLYDAELRELHRAAAAGSAVPAAKPGVKEPSAIELVDRMIGYAILAGASDIHVEPYEFEVLVRYRIDGVLHEVLSIRPESYAAVAARIKVLADMRVDEKRAPQDGRFEVDLTGAAVDLRVSSMPTLWGEKVVMRVLSSGTAIMDLDDLGLAPQDFHGVLRSIKRPYGMILITGPTGSGKTSTLYAMITRLHAERQGVLNISTIEDPIERPIARINQIALNPAAGIDFASGLRALLRQDPDVIMVGEIRDRETADIAVRAALVGRLLFSTLHTNDAPGAILRLTDMGVEPFLLASTLELVVAQRLARRICTSCRESVPRESPTIQVLRDTPAFRAAIPVLQSQGVLSAGGDPLANVRVFRGRGCDQCSGSGFRGRLGLFELLHVTPVIRQMILARRDVGAIRAAAIEGGMKTMFEDALSKVFLGETTVEEAVRVTA